MQCFKNSKIIKGIMVNKQSVRCSTTTFQTANQIMCLLTRQQFFSFSTMVLSTSGTVLLIECKEILNTKERHNYYSNKMHTFIVKSTRYYNLYFLSYILPLHVSTRVGYLQGAQCQCLAKVIINYNLLKLC
jgi:hypothetical protein